MNDIVVQFYLVFLSEFLEGELKDYDLKLVGKDDILAVEADSYWCFVHLMDGIQDHYTNDQPGIQRMLLRMEKK